jgi:hypothetical protein
LSTPVSAALSPKVLEYLSIERTLMVVIREKVSLLVKSLVLLIKSTDIDRYLRFEEGD